MGKKRKTFQSGNYRSRDEQGFFILKITISLEFIFPDITLIKF